MIAEVDKSLFPIITLKTLPVEISNQELEEYLLYQENLLKDTTEKIILIYNTDNSRFLSGDQTVRITNWSKENKALFKEKTLGTCVVSSSVLSNLMIKGIKLLMKSSFEAEVFSNMEDAIKWAQKQLETK
jgi:hypothetical protein